MDLKCYECVVEQWDRLGEAHRQAIADHADPAVTMREGTALCAEHARVRP